MDEEDQALPTFNRFPFAEMKNSNCWSEPPHNVFMIRGPDYLSDKKKVTAGLNDQIHEFPVRCDRPTGVMCWVPSEVVLDP